MSPCSYSGHVKPLYDDDNDDVDDVDDVGVLGPRSSCPDSAQWPRGRLSVCQGRVSTHRTTQPHHASACQQLRPLRAQARRHHRRQGLHLQGVEKSAQLSQDQHTQRKHSRQCAVHCSINKTAMFLRFLVIISFILFISFICLKSTVLVFDTFDRQGGVQQLRLWLLWFLQIIRSALLSFQLSRFS